MRQQLDSFNEFICSNMQEIVDEYGTFVVKPEAQHDPGTPISSQEGCITSGQWPQWLAGVCAGVLAGLHGHAGLALRVGLQGLLSCSACSLHQKS